MANKTQWQKRVDVTQFVYACLLKNFNKDEIKKDMLNFTFDANQLKIIEYFADNKKEIDKLFSNNLSENWTWDRIAPMQQSILIVAYCETKAIKQPIAIAIDQALVTAKKYGQLEAKKFINAILDKVLKNK